MVDQTRSSRLGLGLTAPAPHHQPCGHHHPEDQERLQFRFADELFVSDFPVAYVAFSRCLRLCCAARMAAHACSFARFRVACVAESFLYIMDASPPAVDATGRLETARPDARADARSAP